MSLSLSRRNFLEVGALSATAFALGNLGSTLEARGQTRFAPSKAATGRDYADPQARLIFSLNQDWQFFRPHSASANAHLMPSGDTAWETATLPHTVRLEPRDVSGGLNYQGVCWYKRELRLRPEWKGRVLYLKFQGAMQVADLWLNGEHLTTHFGGYLPFTVDISKAARFDGDNILMVRLDNSDDPEVPPGKPQNQLDFTYFGGLYRSVDLEVLQPVHITDPILAGKVAGGGIFVRYPAVTTDEATIEIQTEVANESAENQACTVIHELIEMNGSIAASLTQTASLPASSTHHLTQALKVNRPRLWHPEDPQLYWLHTKVQVDGRVVDDQYTRIGIRSIRFETDRGLLINGQPFFSIGANRHQDHPYVGYALSPSAHFRDAYKLRDAGFTSYRSHYPQDPSFMDACDELGILAIVSNPGWQFVGDEVFKRRACQGAREMIRRDRNHPCVIIWEAQLNESDNSSLAADFYRIVHEEYPGPDCYTAGDPIEKPVPGFAGWDIHYEGYRMDPAGPSWIKDPSRPAWIREWADQVDNWSDQQGRVRIARHWGEMPMLVQASTHLLRMDRVYLPECKGCGADLWAGIDAYRGYHHQPFQGGPLSLFRLPKFDYYMFQSQRPAERKPAPAGSGPMVFIASFASFDSPSLVTVFSNCEEVRLLQNGKVVGTQKPDSGYNLPHPPFTFRVGDVSDTHTMLFSNGIAPLQTEIGELRAEGLIHGEVMAAHVVRNPGVPDHIELEVDTCGIEPVADGADWVRAHANVCDARGTTYPFSDDLVTFSVSGEGELIEDPRISANPLRAEAGIATALVRMSRTAGNITVRATAPGLMDGVAQFRSRTDQRSFLAVPSRF